MTEAARRFYEFDSFLLDAQERLLFREGEREPVELTPKLFDILLELVQNSGRVLEKKELMDRIWPGSFVEESNLTQQISILRKKLGQSAGAERRYILTVPGRGYRFVASVRELWDDDEIVTVHERVRSRIIIGRDAETSDANAISERSAGAGLVKGEVAPQVIELPESRSLVVPERASPTVNVWRRALLLTALLLLIAVGLTFGLRQLLKENEAPVPFAKTKLVKFTTSGKATAAAISPDGQYVAYTNADAGRESLWLRQAAMSSGGVEVIAPQELNYLSVTFSPDGQYLYYQLTSLEKGKTVLLYRVPKLGGVPAKLLEDVDSPVAFSPDGKRLAFVRGYPDQDETSIVTAAADGTSEARLATLKGPRDRFMLQTGLAWSPGGKSIACSFRTTDERGEYQELMEVEVAGGAIKPITRARWQRVESAAWLRDGPGLMLIAADQESLLTQVWHVSYPAGTARKITNDLSDYQALSLTTDAQAITVVQSSQKANLWIVPQWDTTRAAQITNGNYDGLQGIAWTPDNQLIYTAQTGDTQSLWTASADGSRHRQLTENEGVNSRPAVSADGRAIVFVSTRGGKQQLWRANPDGSQQQLTYGLNDSSPAISPDGQWIVYRSYELGNPNLFKLPINGGQPVRLTEKISGPPAISPDGKLVACLYREEALGQTKLAIIPFEGGPPVKLLDLQSVPSRLLVRWTADGRSLLYINTRAPANIWQQPLDGGPPKQLTDFKTDRIFWFALSNDGQQLALARGHTERDVVLINSVR